MMTTVGKNLIREWLANNAPTPPAYTAVGSDSTIAGVDDTDLNGEFARRAFDSIDNNNNRLVEFEMVLPTTVPATTETLQEVGVFNGSPTGSIFTRNTFAAITKTTDVEVQFINSIRIE